MFTRPLPAYQGLATTMFVGSTAGGVLIAPSNAARIQLTVQGVNDGFRIGPVGSITASTVLLAPSGIVTVLPLHSGAVYANPQVGATVAIAIWESTS